MDRPLYLYRFKQADRIGYQRSLQQAGQTNKNQV